MQILFFLVIVFIFTVFILPPIQSLFFALSLLALLVFGQMLVGAIIILLDSFFFKTFKKSNEKLETYLQKNLSRSIFINRVIVFCIAEILSFIYSPFLAIAASVGIVFWVVVEYMGEQKFQLKV